MTPAPKPAIILECEGTIEDYPGDNSQRSIVGYHYDVKES